MPTKVEVEIPEYRPEKGVHLSWEYGFTIQVRVDEDTVVIRANKPGLISLARQLLTLAQDEVPIGQHTHYDESNSLEDGSCELIIEKV
jgi:hypothetical protein